jgi:triphosphoribosyl-dephospho-CoA synthase
MPSRELPEGPSERGALLAQMACIWEASARKPGNVHRFRDFADTHYLDFLVAAAAIGPVMGKATGQRVGRTVLEAIQASGGVTRVNVNLGIVLLLAPLAKVPVDIDLRRGVERVLAELDIQDSRDVFEAIRLAQPGGLGEVRAQDVRSEPTLPLRRIMELAADRDMVALQYADGFREVFEVGVPELKTGLRRGRALEEAIIHCHLHLLARYPDSLIARKLGRAAAEKAAALAAQVLAADWPFTDESRRLATELDSWLREDGNSRNPGTTADLVAASLYVALREGILSVPLRLPWSAGLHHG